MYFDDAVERINKIDWGRINMEGGKDAQNLGCQFLHRMAIFTRDHSLTTNYNPLFRNIAAELGDKESIDIADYCSIEAQTVLNTVLRSIIMCYLQLAKYSDQNPDAYKYMQVYEPLIQLLEEGFLFTYREGGLMIFGGGLYHLHHWYETYLNKNPD